MRNTLLASLATLPLLAAAPAAADPGGPPGTCDCAAPAVVVVAAPRPALPRWSASLRVGGLGLHPESDPDAHTDYSGGGLSIGYRLAPRWVVAAVVEGGREQLEDGEAGDRHLSLFTIEAQFHPRPYARWDWYLAAGLGGGAVQVGEGEDAITETEGGVVTLGAGIERHIGRWGIGAELRVIGMAVADEEADATARMTTPDEDEHESLSGGAFSLFGAYHF